ncbi:hypothetical protein KVT40_007039 [Elsinoe batatas]|uniref:Uncharacterized protein n=1 Tax=Elsinoe batatas TaxID=2601811 RepID=A0A8K0PFI0_9PEZI|nr:hypothetical protein KVT40_007039 [Elsinoe batatas]
MSKEYEGRNPLDMAKQAEQNLNSYDAKVGRGGNDSTLESGVNESGAQKFPGGDVVYGSAASGSRRQPHHPSRPTKARDFEGLGGPEDKARKYAEDHGGADDVRSNIRDHSTADRSGGGGHVPDVTAKGIGKATDVQ